ncbi:trehalose-6-phosphate synthase [Actinocorallia sp. A-T 12471]|uniref:alpha,alpha-trehalose-phosphate synthase (UDP-forming) n=1 Tax=Actinocorallia sp. A-T 12471 TaxID=3089813 RepID=UPI0029D3B0C1|nr:trehalose-6-phosphate synthase [Actinocorallia sp. A-T 12471]MDX6740257.1 trehalose-6-phosphate synthase [Actinocorallia sp. A-T 12471]
MSDFVVVANRLPVDRVTGPEGEVGWRRSPGGLVTAITPLMRERDGAWIGWTGAADEETDAFTEDGLRLVPVTLSSEDIELYYEGFSNATLWPLYHDAIAPPEYHRTTWDAYVRVNRRFAEKTAEVASKGALVWVQDYQLQLVPKMLRELRPDVRIGFFLHIPFPPSELFFRLPWRKEILEGLLGADLVGFQLPAAAANFVRLSRRLLDVRVHGSVVHVDGRDVLAEAFPISVDVKELTDLVHRPEVRERAAQIRRELGDPGRILLGVDRLDYTKGITQRLEAFGELLADGTLKPGEAVFVQVATPSRERVEQYQILRDDIELQVGRINGEFGALGAPVINYMHTSYSREELAALYLASDVMVVTPLRDGMNLVAKEYVACHEDLRGALVLSEFAGAAEELRRAYLVNPYDVDGLKRILVEAMRADARELQKRMRSMRRKVVDNDVSRWASEFLARMRSTGANAER